MRYMKDRVWILVIIHLLRLPQAKEQDEELTVEIEKTW